MFCFRKGRLGLTGLNWNELTPDREDVRLISVQWTKNCCRSNRTCQPMRKKTQKFFRYVLINISINIMIIKESWTNKLTFLLFVSYHFQVSCSQYLPLPAVHGLVVTKALITVSQDMMANKLSVNFDNGSYIVFDPASCIQVLDWWHPQYPHTSLKFQDRRKGLFLSRKDGNSQQNGTISDHWYDVIQWYTFYFTSWTQLIFCFPKDRLILIFMSDTVNCTAFNL